MALKFRRHLEIAKGRLDMTPLIDVVFLLLLFFMLSSSFVSQPGIRVELPVGAIATAEPGEQRLMVITAARLLFSENQLLGWDQLAARLALETEENRGRTLVIRADRMVLHEDLARAMQMALQHGFRAVYLATRSVEPVAPPSEGGE